MRLVSYSKMHFIHSFLHSFHREHMDYLVNGGELTVWVLPLLQRKSITYMSDFSEMDW